MTMETSDPFATAAPADDPFADPPADPAAEIEAEQPAPPPAEAAEQPEPAADPEAVAAARAAPPDDSPEIPTVDKEGQPVEAGTKEGAEPVYDPVKQTMEQPGEAAPPAQPEAATAPPAEEAPAAEPQPQEAGSGQPPNEPPPAPPAAPEAPDAGAEAPAPAQAPQEAPAAPAEASEGAAANGPGPRGGKGEMRHYRILYRTGATQWTEADLSSVPEGIDVDTLDGPHGPEQWIKARNNDHANRIAFVILGKPEGGVEVFPVPKGAWKPKRVKPAPPAPTRERLVIS